MNPRQEKLLNLVVDSYVATAEPVGSKFLAARGGLDCGEATIRNELRALEEAGYLTHPHTSAGRIPTSKGYRHYINNLDLEKTRLAKKDNDILGRSVRASRDYDQAQKNLAKSLRELSQAMVLLAFSRDRVYYTGLANLFRQPEFSELRSTVDISQVIDHCEDYLDEFFDQVNQEPEFFVGQEHCFGNRLSLVAFSFTSDDSVSLIALIGPQRMNYKKNYALMRRVKEIL